MKPERTTNEATATTSELLGFPYVASSVLRWAYLVVLVCAAFPFVAMFFSVLFAFLAKVSPVFMWNESYTGFMTAFVLIWMSHFLTPSHRRLTGILTLLVGSWAAWHILEPSWYPEWHPKAYRDTHIPWLATVSGGFIGLSVRWILDSAKSCMNGKANP